IACPADRDRFFPTAASMCSTAASPSQTSSSTRRTSRRTFMEVFESTTARFDWTCHRFCLMPNHYHLVIEAMRPKLSRGMHRLNGTYAQWFNALHDRVGHLFQGRFGAYLIESDKHFEAVLRYVDENPVRAGLCASPEDWPWSSAGREAGR